MSRLILVRHGESAGNKVRMFADDPYALPLTELGYAQARAAAEQLAFAFQAELVIASPYLRARETARVIAERLALPLKIDDALYERDVGSFRGMSYDSLHRSADYDHLKPWAWRPAQGESYEDVRARVGPVMDRIAREHPDGDVIIVSHGGVMLALWAHAAGSWEAAHAPPNCGIVLIEHGAKGYSMPQVISGNAAVETGG
jgi:broad specificity phosphatase PhoE